MLELLMAGHGRCLHVTCQSNQSFPQRSWIEQLSNRDNSERAQIFPQKRGNVHLLRLGEDTCYGRLSHKKAKSSYHWFRSLPGLLKGCQEKSLAALGPLPTQALLQDERKGLEKYHRLALRVVISRAAPGDHLHSS